MNIQCDYSTLSTSLSQSEVAALNLMYGVMENVPENEDSSDSRNSSEGNLPPRVIPPKDKYHFVFLAFGLLGIGSLMPWNFFITAHDYWMFKFRNASNHSCVNPAVQRTDLQASFTSYIALAINIPYVIFLILCMFSPSRIVRSRYIVSSLLFMIVVFAVITSLVNVNTDDWQMVFFSLTMFLVVLMGFASAILQAASAGISSVLPKRYIHMMVLCQAVAGITAAGAQIFSLLGECNPTTSAFRYFLSADVILIITLFVYLSANKTPFLQFYLSSRQENKPMKDVSSADVKIQIPITAVIRRVWPFAVCILLTFVVTISIFPGLAVLVVSEHASNGSIWTGRLFLPVACFTLMNFGDFFGRVLGGWIKYDAQAHRYGLLVLSISRIVLIPLFLLCNAHPRSNLPVIFGDVAYICLMAVLGFTNGSLTTLAMIAGTKLVSAEIQDAAGVVLSAFLGVGLLLGSFVCYALIQFM